MNFRLALRLIFCLYESTSSEATFFTMTASAAGLLVIFMCDQWQDCRYPLQEPQLYTRLLPNAWLHDFLMHLLSYLSAKICAFIYTGSEREKAEWRNYILSVERQKIRRTPFSNTPVNDHERFVEVLQCKKKSDKGSVEWNTYRLAQQSGKPQMKLN